MSDIYQQTAALIREEVNRQIDARYQNWVTGKRTGTNTYQLRETGYPNRVYVRPSNESYEARLVWGNAAYVNIPVIIRRLQDGEWQIDDVDFVASGAIGEKVAGMLQPPVAGDGTKLVLPGYNLRPFRLRIDAAGGLNAYVETGFYIYNGVKYYFPGGSVDLTSAVPGTTATWRWVWVGVTPVTHTIVTATSTAQSIYEPLTIDQLAAIATDTDIDSGGVKLRNGQTSLGIVDGDFADSRSHFDTPQGANNEFSSYIQLAQIATPSTPASGYLRLYSKSDDKLYYKTDAGTENELVASSGITNVTSVGTKFDPFAPPSSPATENDEFDDSSVAGAWTEIDHASQITVSEDAAGLLITASGNSQNAGVVKSIPSGDFTIETHAGAGGSMVSALWLCENTTSTSDMVTFGVDTVNNRIVIFTWTAYNSGSLVAGTPLTWYAPEAHLRITRSSTTYTYLVSADGLSWRTVYSGSLSFTPGQFGVQLWTDTATKYARFSFFRYTNSALNAGQHIGGQRVNMVTVS